MDIVSHNVGSENQKSMLSMIIACSKPGRSDGLFAGLMAGHWQNN
jgi:hypothetical protein